MNAANDVMIKKKEQTHFLDLITKTSLVSQECKHTHTHSVCSLQHCNTE